MKKIVSSVSPGTIFLGIVFLLAGVMSQDGVLQFRSELFNLGIVCLTSGLLAQSLIRYFRRKSRRVTAE